MILDQVPAGAQVFVDSNILVYHFQPHPRFGPMCQRLLERIERLDIEGFTSTSLLAEVAHRLCGPGLCGPGSFGPGLCGSDTPVRRC